LSHLFVDVNFTIFENILINEQRQKKISVDWQRIEVCWTQHIFGWIRDPEKNDQGPWSGSQWQKIKDFVGVSAKFRSKPRKALLHLLPYFRKKLHVI
jgi:hypothetical protein